MSNLRVKFVSKKINRIRWKPPNSSIFFTGSCDDETNQICAWQYPDLSSKDEDDMYSVDPFVIADISFPGSVTDLKVTNHDLVFASSTLGSLSIYKHSDTKLSLHHKWDNVHNFLKNAAPATAITVKGNDVASVGEDGRLCVYNFNKLVKDRTIESSDLCALTSVSYLRHREIITGNVLGYLRTWDLKSPSDQPSHISMISGDQVGIMCMNIHPTQPHILATGHEDGTLCIWDLRQERRPASVLVGHTAAVTEVLFHPLNPDYLYTCSMDGSVFQWDASALKSGVDDHDSSTAGGNPWLNCDASQHRINITSLFTYSNICVNTLDINSSMLLWGTDTEALYILQDIIV